MSNGDDVLDNWEEIDEAVLNSSVQTLKISSSSCERITDKSFAYTGATTSSNTSSSKPKEMKVLQRSNNQETTTTPLSNSALDDISATFQPVLMVLHKPQDEYQSANYTAPIANQTVKILRRPTQSTEIRNNGVRPRQPIKTLQQREQEYAEARLRILGSAKNPEDEEQRASAASTTSVVTSSTNSTPSTHTATTVVSLSNMPVTNMVTNSKVISPKMQVVANQYNNHYNQQQQQQKYQQNYQQQQQQQQQQQKTYFYSQQPQPQTPAYNNNRTYSMNPLLALGPMGAIGQPAQYQTTTLVSPQAQQQHLKYQQYHQKSPQQQQQQQTWSPVVGGSVSSSSLRQQQTDPILRLPRGPDGSTGFQMHR